MKCIVTKEKIEIDKNGIEPAIVVRKENTNKILDILQKNNIQSDGIDDGFTITAHDTKADYEVIKFLGDIDIDHLQKVFDQEE